MVPGCLGRCVVNHISKICFRIYFLKWNSDDFKLHFGHHLLCLSCFCITSSSMKFVLLSVNLGKEVCLTFNMFLLVLGFEHAHFEFTLLFFLTTVWKFYMILHIRNTWCFWMFLICSLSLAALFFIRFGINLSSVLAPCWHTTSCFGRHHLLQMFVHGLCIEMAHIHIYIYGGGGQRSDAAATLGLGLRRPQDLLTTRPFGSSRFSA